ncbi:cell wall surface anchor family protein [Filimonas lacunae]|nr:cell wall surface anchor family protein [Filimonas lacunae]
MLTNRDYRLRHLLCKDSAEVTLTGATGGSFTSTSGLVINKTSGTVDLAKSTVGAYWITYSFSNSDGCTDTTGAAITIHALPTATIAYGTYCARDSAEVTLTGATGGQYTSTSGLVINKTSGTVDLAKSGVGSYWITTASATAMAVQIHRVLLSRSMRYQLRLSLTALIVQETARK